MWIKNRTKELWKGYKNSSFKLPEEVEKKFGLEEHCYGLFGAWKLFDK